MSIRGDFPILARQVGDRPLVYLDNAATTQKPRAVLEALETYYANHNANVHRAAHQLAGEATALLEGAREKVATYLHAANPEEVVFTRGTTEAINLVANVLTGAVSSGDEILITYLDHHSNIVPWQMLAQRTGAKLLAVNVTASGDLDLADLEKKLGPKTRVFAFNHVSNALGTINPARELIAKARQFNALTVVDGAQAALHEDIDVAQLDCDFYAISGHKIYAPTGIGALYGKMSLLEELPPWQGGGEMIEQVRIDASTYQKPPFKFEAGTPNIAGAIGLGAAIDYLNSIDKVALTAAEDKLVTRALMELAKIPTVKFVGEPQARRAVISFLIEGLHPHDAGTLLDQQGVAVRTGHHCTMPLMEQLQIPGTIRASFSLYNDDSDVDALIAGIHKLQEFV
ncbi:MAG: SufS family cysteine desulfurase [Pseudomonadota bacterium]